MEYTYHGSSIPGITELEARSLLHGSGQKVVYLTGNLPYALFYIWDENRVGFSGKHVTGWLKDGIAYYEDQFPDQLKQFYQNVSGYLYYITDNADIKAVDGRESMYYSLKNQTVHHVVPIPDVYKELLKYESVGQLKVLRYLEQPEKRQNELTKMIATVIAKSGFFESDVKQRQFMKRYFSKAWELAVAEKAK